LISDAPLELAVPGWFAFATLLVHASHRLLARSARHEFLPLPIQQHAWLAGMVGLGTLWSLQIRIEDHLHLSMIGVSLYALVFGYTRALLGAATAVAGLALLTGHAWLDVGINGVLLGALPAAIAAALQKLLRSRLPHNVFVFIIGNGLFATWIASACAGGALVAAQIALLPAPPPDGGEILAYTLLLAWGEALMSGMIFSSLVIFRPQVVMTYEQHEYLPHR
jgi:uncharacterized membrane protein